MNMIGGSSSARSPSQLSALNRFRCSAITVRHVLLAVALIFSAPSATGATASGYRRPSATCPDTHWLSTALDACAPCTECSDERTIVLRPCQPHKDTVCGTLNDMEFEWSWVAPVDVRPAGDEVAHWNDEHHGAEIDSTLTNWQMASLVFAVLVFVLFLVAVTYILYQHAKQWRHMENMERRFDRDVEQLSARLMHNIVDLRSIENGRIILNESPPTKDRTINPREVRCVYLEQLLIGKDLSNSPLRGNVYTEEAKG